MRRIIERVVTVVTTTTWKISWETDTPQPDHTADSVSNELPSLDALTPWAITAIETKEVHPSSIESEPASKADEPPHPSYPPKKERKSKP